MQLVSKISNLCDPDPPTSQTDGRTDDMRSQDRAFHRSASRGKNWFRPITTVHVYCIALIKYSTGEAIAAMWAVSAVQLGKFPHKQYWCLRVKMTVNTVPLYRYWYRPNTVMSKLIPPGQRKRNDETDVVCEHSACALTHTLQVPGTDIDHYRSIKHRSMPWWISSSMTLSL